MSRQRISYSDAPPELLEKMRRVGLLNQCGPEGMGGEVPDWVFPDCCDEHDWDYHMGHAECDRREADWRFYERMLVAASRQGWWVRWWYRFIAWTYYRSVSKFGRGSFHYAPTYRDLGDLEALVREREQELS